MTKCTKCNKGKAAYSIKKTNESLCRKCYYSGWTTTSHLDRLAKILDLLLWEYSDLLNPTSITTNLLINAIEQIDYIRKKAS